ncbi:MAG: EamA family transporter [Microbacteriaceae bacterium]
MTTPEPRSRVPLGAVGFVIVGLLCQEIGASIAVLVFPQAGPAGMVTLRLVFSALILLAVARPRLRGIPARSWRVLILFGLTLGAMNLLFYEAIARINLGAAVTIEVLGPLVLSVIIARRASAWLWAGLAFVGVALLGQGGFAHLEVGGVLFAGAAGVTWAAYILASRKTGEVIEGLGGLAIAMSIGSIAVLPFGISQAGATLLDPGVLALGAAVALLSSAVPYALELIALRRISASTFGVLMSSSPAIATIAGFVILHQTIGLLEAIGIVVVITASIGAVRMAPPPPTVAAVIEETPP